MAQIATTANAPGIIVNGTTVSVVVPNSTDDSLRAGGFEAAIESADGTLPSPAALHMGFVNSCAASPSTGISVCSGLFGSSVMVRPPRNKPGAFKTGVKKRIHFTGGDCANCGVLIDDAATGGPTAIISTSAGYLPVQLNPFLREPILSTNGAPITGNFGYDPINHRILSPGYQIFNLHNFSSGNRHFQIIDLNGGQVFELSDNNEFFDQGTCVTSEGGFSQRDALPDSGAYDVATGIGYVTFRSPSDCIDENAVEDIGLIDLTQATFDSTAGTWSDSAKQIQTLAEMYNLTNGITGIAIAPTGSLAIVCDRREIKFGSSGFGALQLPSSSGSGTPCDAGLGAGRNAE